MPSQLYASSAKTGCFIPGKGGKGHELNLDHGIFEDYSGPVKCFSCSAMMEVKSKGGEVYSIDPLAVYESKRSSVRPTEKRI
jgi:hypothetical protein